MTEQQETTVAEAALVMDTVVVVEPEQVTPIKRDNQATKKAFLKRGSSAKYDP